MRKINFVQGYYEWNVYVDNKCVFTFNDKIEFIFN